MSSPPPTYSDLGKSARDLFGKGFHFGLVKLDVKTKTSSGVQLTSGGQSNTESGKVSGNLEVKHNLDQGVTLTTKWNTDNIINTTLGLQDNILKGLKLTLDSSLANNTGSKSGHAKAEFKSSMLNILLDTDLNLVGPVVNTSAVLGKKGWLAGLQMAYDTSRMKLIKNNLALGYSTKDFVLHANVNDGATFGASLFQKVNPNMEAGVNLGWTASSSTTTCGLAVKYQLDKDASLRAKINSSSQLGLGYSQKLKEGIIVTLSTLVDGKNFNQGGHKVGLGIELES